MRILNRLVMIHLGFNSGAKPVTLYQSDLQTGGRCSHLLRLPPDEDAQHFAEEARQQRVEWRLVLQEPVQFHE